MDLMSLDPNQKTFTSRLLSMPSTQQDGIAATLAKPESCAQV
jgi:hypothetical protein